MSAALTWLAASAPVPHWLTCLGAICTFILAVQLVAFVFVVTWANYWTPADDGK